MSATIYLAICILGCDFLLYFLYQWTYGEKRRGLSKKSRAPKTIVEGQNVQPFLVAFGRATAGQQRSLHVMRGRAEKRAIREYVSFGEKQAYRRIAASLAQAKR
jgi:hypothetical protein